MCFNKLNYKHYLKAHYSLPIKCLCTFFFNLNKVKRKAALGINRTHRFVIHEKKLSKIASSAVVIQIQTTWWSSRSVAISVPKLTFQNSDPSAGLCGKSHGIHRLLMDSGRWPMTAFSWSKHLKG